MTRFALATFWPLLDRLLNGDGGLLPATVRRSIVAGELGVLAAWLDWSAEQAR